MRVSRVVFAICLKAALDGKLGREAARERNRDRLFEAMARGFAVLKADATDAQFLDPRRSAVPFNQIALALYYSGEYEGAADAANRAIRSSPNYPNTYRWLAAALGQLGRIEEARHALEKAIAIAPAAFNLYVKERLPWRRPEDYAHMLEGLRKAAWRED